MKKLFLLLGITFIVVSKITAQSCMPNFNVSVPGIYPDSLPNLVAGQPYEAVFTIRTYGDTCITTPTPFCIDVQGMKIYSVDGLPAGFVCTPTYNAGDYWLNPGDSTNGWQSTNVCFVVSAPAAAVDAAIAAGDFFGITVEADLLGKMQGPNAPFLQTYDWTSTISVWETYALNLGESSNCYYNLFYQNEHTNFAGLLPTAGTFDLQVSAPDGCFWQVEGSCDNWLTFSPTSGTGSGTVAFTYAANTTAEGRACTLVIGGQQYYVSQIMDSCAVTLSADSSYVGPLNSTLLIDLSTLDPECYWNLVTRSACDWVDVSPMYGTGSTTLTVNINWNHTTATRTCELDFGNGVTYTFTQDAGTSVDETAVNNLQLFPNPAGDMVSLRLPTVTEGSRLTIYTIEGQLLQSENITSAIHTINTSSLNNGMYLFVVESTNGIIGRNKIIISR